MLRPKSQRLSEDQAESLALQVLTFLLADAKQISRFLALTGTAPQDLRDVATTRELQVATLEYLLSDEGLLLTFCQETGVDPTTIAPALRVLTGPSEL
ncbi:MAG: DUF3572 domain-containing protein [Proteobacteria bacterium]|nr:DUF3572 domain-containing protein [Pseudomonadota bacterium]